MSQPPQDQKQGLIELLTLEFADTAYQRKSTPAGSARKRAFSAFGKSLPHETVKWASCVEDPRRVFMLSSWEPGTYNADCSLSTVVKPLTEHLSGAQWSRQLIALDSTSTDITSPLWGRFRYELRVLDFRVPDECKQEPVEYWKEQEDKVIKVLETVRRALTMFGWIRSMPPAVKELGHLGIVGGWVLAEDGTALREGSGEGVADMKSRKWAGILGWGNESGERKAWGEDGTGQGQECLQSLCSIADGIEQRWHATTFEVLGDGNHRYAFPSSDEDDS